VTLTRAEANAVAFRVVCSILDAADTLHTFELVVEDRPIQVDLSRGSASALPAGGLLGIDPERDGVVPRHVRASATWLGGSVTLDVRLDWWRGGSYKSLVGIGVYVVDSRRSVLWNTLALTLEGSGDGSAVVSASVAPFKRKGDTVEEAEARVDAKCKEDPSLAVAHGCFWRHHPAKAFAWELRLQDEIREGFTIDEPGSDEARAEYLRTRGDEAEAAREKERVRRERKAKRGEEREEGVEQADEGTEGGDEDSSAE
jgi:hypothetical protein